MATIVKLLLLLFVGLWLLSGVYSVYQDLQLRTIEAEVARRLSEKSDTKGERDKAFKKFRECVRNGETWNNCIEEN